MNGEDRTQRRIDDLERRLKAHPQDDEAFVALLRANMSAGRHIQAEEAMEARLRESAAPDWGMVQLFCEAARQCGRAARAHEVLQGLERTLGSERRLLDAARAHARGDGPPGGGAGRARAGHRARSRPMPRPSSGSGVTLMKLHRDDEALGRLRALPLARSGHDQGDDQPRGAPRPGRAAGEGDRGVPPRHRGQSPQRREPLQSRRGLRRPRPEEGRRSPSSRRRCGSTRSARWPASTSVWR